MSAPTAAEQQDQTSETPQDAVQAPTRAVQAEPQAEPRIEPRPDPHGEPHGEPHTESQTEYHTQSNIEPLTESHTEPRIAQESTQAPIQSEDDIAIDDSTSDYSDEISTYTASLTSSVLNYPTENGRRYHAFREGTYYIPNDESEQDRMDIHHEMMSKACGGRLHVAPLTKPGRILDLGTGTGIWCVEMGDAFPDAEVIGNDFSPVQPNMVPRNVKFEVDDMEAPWTHPTKFDYIHCRFMAGSIADWPKLIQTCYDNLNPGAIAEFQDGDFRIYSEDGSYKDSWYDKWNTDFVKAADMNGRTLRPGPDLYEWFTAAGFEDIHHEKLRIPKEVGAFNLVQLKEGIEGFSLALFTRVLGWAVEEVQVLLSKVRKDLEDRSIHSQNDLYIVWGRKPGATAQ